jgi:hypothetical protein
MSQLYIGTPYEFAFSLEATALFYEIAMLFLPMLMQSNINCYSLQFHLQQKALDAAMSDINNSFGKGSVTRLGSAGGAFVYVLNFLILSNLCYKFHACYHADCYCVYPVRLFQVAV